MAGERITPATEANKARILHRTCPHCEEPIVDGVRHCPACGMDWGAPNVRSAGQTEEREALLARSAAAADSAERRGVTEQLNSLASAVTSSSHVVFALPTMYARQLIQDPRQVYQNYETLVGSGARVLPGHTQDAERAAVGALLFGSCAKFIRYGVLSLDGSGLSTYGRVFLELRDVAVKDRVSFLETNSYRFVEKFGVSPAKPPPRGYRSIWDDRHHLATAKLHPRVAPTHSAADWATLLVETDGKDRSQDEFIEAHVYEGFNVGAVKSIRFTPTAAMSRNEKLDAKVIKGLWQDRNQGGSQ